MRTVLAVIAMAVALPGCWTRIAPDDPRLRYAGRMDRSDPAGPRFSFTGTGVIARVEARQVRIHLRDVPRPWEGTGRLEANHYEILIDDKSAGVLVAKAPDQVHTVELGPGEHVVQLYKRTEPAVGQGQLLGIDLPRGARLLEPPERPARRIEFLGDSVTNGFGNAGAGPQCPFSAATEDGFRSYAAIAGRQLGAEIHIVAWHGRGVVRNYDLGAADTLPKLYERTLPEEPGSRWDFSRWVPQVVIINAGTNDFLQPGLDVAAFERGYLELVKQVRRSNPEAFILCAYPSVTDDWPQGVRHGTLSREAVDRVMKRAGDEGMTRVKAFGFDPIRPEDGFGCAYHPSLRTHEAMAGRLRAVVSEAMGW